MGPQNTRETVLEQHSVNFHFEQAASEWAAIYERHGLGEFIFQERLRIALDLVTRIGLPLETPVLEVGCGAGFATLGIAKMGYAVDAIDPVQAMIDATHERARRAGLERRVRSRLGDVHDLQFPNETFGLVVAMGVLPWLSSLEQPIEEMCRVLRPNGYLIISAYNKWALRNVFEPLTNPILLPAKKLGGRLLRGHHRPQPYAQRISLQDCDALLDASGLQKVESLTLGFGPFTVFNREFVPCDFGLKMHHRLQALADRGFPVLRSGGSEYITLRLKSNPQEQKRA